MTAKVLTESEFIELILIAQNGELAIRNVVILIARLV
jgi:hypothetical protein